MRATGDTTTRAIQQQGQQTMTRATDNDGDDDEGDNKGDDVGDDGQRGGRP
jgi:hypothetical protein